MMDDSQEIFPIVDESGHGIGRATRGECHNGSMLLHPVVHLHLFNSHGQLFLQKRPDWKDIQPGKWDTAVGGHVGPGEPIESALLREAHEELGISDFKPLFLKKYVFESPRERELVHVFTTVYDDNIQTSNELDGGDFWSLDDIRANIGTGIFTPNFEQEFLKLKF